jgi:hypothetical protein
MSIVFSIKENLFGWDQVYHDINEVHTKEQENKSDATSSTIIDNNQTFDPRDFRSLAVSLRVALHTITAHFIHVRLNSVS